MSLVGDYASACLQLNTNTRYSSAAPPSSGCVLCIAAGYDLLSNKTKVFMVYVRKLSFYTYIAI